MNRLAGKIALYVSLCVAAPGFFLYWTAIRNDFYHPSAEERSAVGEAWARNGVAVAVVWPPHSDLSFNDGVRLAWEQVNAEKGPFAGKIRLRFIREKLGAGEEAAHAATGHADVVAVLGHELSSNAIPASMVYESHGVLFLTPKSTDPRLTTHGFQYVFRLTPDDRGIARSLVAYANKRGLKRIAVLYARTEHGESAATRFVAEARDGGLAIPFYRSYLADEGGQDTRDFRPLIAEMRREDYDAVMVADALPRVAKLVRDLGRMGVTQPILATDKADSYDLWRLAGQAANNVYVASAVDPSSQTPAYRAFRARFCQRYGQEPGYGASQGYEALMLLVKAFTASQTADPLIVATTLRTRSWTGLFGPFSFDNNGDILGRAVSVKRMLNGQFITMHL